MLREYYLLISPLHPVLAAREPYFSFVRLLIHDLKEHVPGVIPSEHEGVGNNSRWYVCDIVASENRIVHMLRRFKTTRRRTIIDPNRPLILLLWYGSWRRCDWKKQPFD